VIDIGGSHRPAAMQAERIGAQGMRGKEHGA
jgi:hypothetical protein